MWHWFLASQAPCETNDFLIWNMEEFDHISTQKKTNTLKSPAQVFIRASSSVSVSSALSSLFKSNLDAVLQPANSLEYVIAVVIISCRCFSDLGYLRSIGLPINISQWIGWFWGPSKPQSIRGLTIKPWDLPLKNHHFPFWRGNFLEYPLVIKHGLLDNSPFDMIYPFKLPLMGDFPGNYVWLIENINPSSIQETNSHCNMISHSIPLALNPTYSDLWNFMSKMPDFYWGIRQRPKNGWFLEKPLRRPTHFL